MAELSVMHLLILGWLLVGVMGLYAVIAYFVYRAQKALPVGHQKIAPSLAFLLIIPVAGLAMIFVLAILVPSSFQSFFRERNLARGDCGKTLGLVWAGCAAVSVVPGVICLAGIPALVCMVLFLVKINTLAGEATAIMHQTPSLPDQV